MPPLTGDYARDMQALIEDRRRLNVAISEWIAGLEDKDAIRLDQAQITAPNGIIFPSGTFSDYVPPTSWTPVLTFATPGNLSVTYGTQVGRVTALDDVVIAHFAITTTGFTHTTASGDAEITGLSLISLNVTGLVSNGAMGWAGITKAGYTDVVARVPPNSSSIKMLASGSGVASSFVSAADMPTGGTVTINGTVVFLR